MTKILYYIHDPMCSWCWAFKPTWDLIQSEFEGTLNIVKLLGGLAPDSNELMSVDLRNFLRQTWKTIEVKVPGTNFNFDFWKKCQPRRSTYPACRAVIAARKQSKAFEDPMIEGIQKAYYLESLNPSDHEILLSVADKLGVNSEIFATDLNSGEARDTLLEEINLVRQLGVSGFPGLVFFDGVKHHHLSKDYNSPRNIIGQIKAIGLD